jgi:sentrin-specific protease 1
MDQYLFSSGTGKPFQELSIEEKGKIAEYLKKTLRTREEKNRSVKSDLWGIQVTNGQIQCLREKNWLNDQVINLNLILMAQRDILNYFMSTFFFSCLYNLQFGKYDYLYGRKQYPANIDIFAFEKVFVPINIGNFHWILAVIYMECQAIYLFDSMSSSTHSKRILNALLQFLCHEKIFRKKTSLAESDASINANWTLVDSMTRCPQQDNSYDCGVFTTMFADKLSKNDSLTTCVQREALNYRELMAAAIINLAVEYVKTDSNNNK